MQKPNLNISSQEYWEGILKKEGMGDVLKPDALLFYRPAKIDMYSEPFAWGSEEDIEPSSPKDLAKVRFILDHLSPSEKLLLIWWASGIRQSEMASRLKLKQPTVCFRLKKIRRKAVLLSLITPMDEQQIIAVALEYGAAAPHAAALAAYYRTFNYRVAAESLGSNSSTVKTHVTAVLEKLPDDHPIAQAVSQVGKVCWRWDIGATQTALDWQCKI